MTDRVQALTVVLDRDIRDDDVQPIIDAIHQLRHVISVVTNVVDTDDFIARQRVAHHIRKRIYEIFTEEMRLD